MKFTAATILSLAATANAAVVSLTAENAAELTAGKNVFVKFFAPWCGHCQQMAPDWEKLAADWEGHEVGLVAEVDCTTESGEELCNEMGIEGFPTLKYGDWNDLEDFEDERDYEALSKFAKETISKKPCTLNDIDACEDEKKDLYKKFMAMSKEELEAFVMGGEDKIEEAERKMKAEVKLLKKQYKELQNALDAVSDELVSQGLNEAIKVMEHLYPEEVDDVKDEL